MAKQQTNGRTGLRCIVRLFFDAGCTNQSFLLVGPIVEAFGFSRIIFASSTPAVPSSTPENWYELAREAVAELGIDQDGVDAIFGGNAKAIYSAV